MRRRLASAPSLLAMAAMMLAIPAAARAQSLNATGTIVAGAGAILTAPGTTTVAADSPNLVINWAPDDTAIGGGPIDFQTAGTSALFTNRDANTLTVLNRVIPADVTRPIVFNGLVTSQLIDLASGAISRGGTLFFYSPGGILVSSTGAFNVGNLALTASDLNFDAVTGSFETSSQYNFLPANAGSRIEVQRGAQIAAGPFNAYVALIAPRVIHSGTINVDGSAVIVAADASTITFRPDGLYTIEIEQGTSAAGEVVTNDGTITGPVAGINAAHRVYMVAVPKNDAITMAIKGGSALGFDVAGAANVDGNAVVLSAGYDVVNGVIDTVRASSSGAVPARLAIGAIDATSQVTGQATGAASLTLGAGEAANFASNVLLSGVSETAADDGAFISVGGISSALDVRGNLQITSLDGGQVAGGNFTDSGHASITVDQGRLTVGGSTSISSVRAPTLDIDAIAGNATLTASNGAVVDVGTDLTIAASAAGKNFDDFSSSGPNAGTGGVARVSLESGSSITIGRNLVLNAIGGGGSGLDDFTVGSDGNGGQALVEAQGNGGTLTVAGITTLDARGIGGSGQNCTTCTVEGGSGTGGRAGISLGAGAAFAFGDAVTINASGQGGAATTDSGKDGGSGLGGTAFVRTVGGTATFAQTLDVLADGLGGAGALVNAAFSGATGSGGTGGRGTGGEAILAAGGDAALQGGGGILGMTGVTVVSAAGQGGAGGTGGAGTGGTATLAARNGAADGGGLSVRAYGDGGAGANGGNGGAGTGGNADVIAFSALEGEAAVRFSGTLVDARGRGGAGSAPGLFPDAGGAGGAGTGGQARAVAEAGNANLILAGASVTANGIGGAGGAGGDAFSAGTGGTGGSGGVGRGGSATIGAVAGPGSASPVGGADFGQAGVFANGFGGAGGAGGSGSTPGLDGNGGNAFGGGAAIMASDGNLNLGSTTVVEADAIGGDSGSGFGGSAEVGGAGGPSALLGARLEVGSGQLFGQTIAFSANASAGLGAIPGTATILGHPLTWLISGGTVNADSLTFTASGTVAGDSPPSVIALRGGDTILTGNLVFNTPGDLSATLDGADVSAIAATISAGNWVPGAAPAGAAGTVFGSSSVTLTTGGDLFAHLSASSGSALTLSAIGRVRLDNLSAAAGVAVAAGSTISLGDILAGADVAIGAPGNVAVSDLTASGGIALNSDAALTSGGATAGQTITLAGANSVTAGSLIQAGDSVRIVSNGAIGAGAISAGLLSPSLLSSATYGITVVGQGSVTLGNLAAARDIVLLSPVVITSGSLAGREIALLSGGAQSVGGITASGRVLLADYAMGAIGGDPLGVYDLNAVLSAAPIAAGGPIMVTGAANVGSLSAVSNGAVAVGAIAATPALGADGSVNLSAGTALVADAIDAGNRIDLTAGSTIALTSARAGNGVSLGAVGAITSGNITGTNGSVQVAAGGDATLGDLTGQVLLGGIGIDVTAGGALSLGNASGTAVSFSANRSVAFGDATATDGDVIIGAGDAIRGGAITALGKIELANSAGAVVFGSLDAASTVLINAAGDLAVGNVNAAQTTVELRANTGSLTAGAVTAATDAALIASGDLTVGTMRARDMLLLAGGSVRASALDTQAGRILAASNAVGLAGGAIGAYDFNAVFAEPLVAADGALTLAGPVTAGTFTAAVAGDVVTQGISAARSIFLDTGSTARLDGLWRSPSIELRASDLVMPAGSGLDAGVSGTITLVSRNAAGLRIGDGLDGSVVPASGFSIDNSEWGRIDSGSLSVFGLDGAGAVDIVIGKLDVTGPDAGSTIDDPAGSVRFSTAASPTAAASGAIRIVGALRAVGMRSGNALVFRTGQFQLASDTGSVAVLGQGDALSGTVRIEARDIHVAAAPLLARLAADPFFAGVEPALDRESAGGNGPVLRAGGLDFTIGRSFYIQRSGSGIDPLGFEEPLDGFTVRSAGTGPIAVIINGTFRTASGIVGGAEAWRQFKASGVDLSAFTADSRLNGCLLTAATCGLVLIKGQPDPGIRTVIDGVGTPMLDDSPSDPEKPEPNGGNAILPPPLLLPVQPDTLGGHIDEPIAGSGNPALSGGTLSEVARP